MNKLPLTITAAAQALRNGEMTSVEIVQAAFDRADAFNATLGVYLQRFDEPALVSAERADIDLAAGLDKGPLHGIPIGVKDILAAGEGPTTANSLVLDRTWGADKDAIVVERLRAAGAVITGKLTTMEFAMGLHDLGKPHPRPRNPWNPETWPGGSSSGTGAGVASGMFLAGIGTDTGGSIRIPAAYCGVSGLMPTYGRVPTAGCVPLGYTLDHVGPLARSAHDCGLILEAISGDDPRDPYTVPAPPLELASTTGNLHGLQIGVALADHVGGDLDDPALASSFNAATETLSSLGATLVDIRLPNYQETITAQMVTMLSEAAAYHKLDMQSRWTEYYRATRTYLGCGALLAAADYVQAQRVRRVVQRKLADLFASVDVVVTPTTATGAPSYYELDQIGADPRLETIFTPYWDAVGNPVLVVPMGFTQSELPLSLQIAGRPFDEATLVRVADAYQAKTDWHLRTPPLLTSTP